VINVNYWRKYDVFGQATTFILENPEKLEYWDQDALNYVLHKRWGALPVSWNVTSGCVQAYLSGELKDDEMLAGLMRPNIMHFSASIKPWHYISEHPWKAQYYRYLKFTPFSQYVPPDKTVLRMMIKSIKFLISPFTKKFWRLYELKRIRFH
jgi:lipopolysaccharide biosynthesis glycosyltransferase